MISLLAGLRPINQDESNTINNGLVEVARLPIPAAVYFMAKTYMPRYTVVFKKPKMASCRHSSVLGSLYCLSLLIR
ncbi:hypothetical protein D3C72_2230680 [compost metagenome]